MREQNGVKILSQNDDLSAFIPKGLSIPNWAGLFLRYGAKAELKANEFVWVPGTEDDYRQAEGQKLGVAPEVVPVHRDCMGAPPCTGLGPCGEYGTGLCYTHFYLGPGPNGTTMPYYYCSAIHQGKLSRDATAEYRCQPCGAIVGNA